MLMELDNDEERKALQELMQVENSNKMLKDIDSKMDRLRDQQRATQDRLKAEDDMSQSRLARRHGKQLEKYTSMLSEASNMNFRETSKTPMNPEEIDDNLMGMIEQIEPSIISKEVARSGVDPNTGQRIIEQEKPKKTKKERKLIKENK